CSPFQKTPPQLSTRFPFPWRGRIKEGVILSFDQHPHLNLPRQGGRNLIRNHANSVRSCRTCSSSASNAISQYSRTPSFQFLQSLFQPVQHVRHVVCPIVVATVDSAAGIMLIVYF